MQLTIEQVTTAKTGKSLRVKANGEWYGANLKSGLQDKAGTVIEAETEESQDFGKWINKWKAVGNGVAGQTPQKPPAAGNGSAWLPFASNTVAHAITAGLITEPGQVSAWVKAAKEAYEALA